jgi:hypothetical protein
MMVGFVFLRIHAGEEFVEDVVVDFAVQAGFGGSAEPGCYGVICRVRLVVWAMPVVAPVAVMGMM